MKKTIIGIVSVIVCILAAFSFAACNNDKTDDAAELAQLKQQTIEKWDNIINSESTGLKGYVKQCSDNYLEEMKEKVKNAKTLEDVEHLRGEVLNYRGRTLKRYYNSSDYFEIINWTNSASLTITGKYDGEEYSFTLSYDPFNPSSSPIDAYYSYNIKTNNEQYLLDVKTYGEETTLFPCNEGDKTRADATKATNMSMPISDKNVYLSVIVKKGEELAGYTVLNFNRNNQYVTGFPYITDTQSFVKSDDKKATKEDATRLVEDAIAGKKSDVNVKLRANKATHKLTEYTSDKNNVLNLTVVSARKDDRSEIKFDMADKTTYPNRSVNLRARSNVDFDVGANIKKSIDFSDLDTSIYASTDDTNGYIKVMVEEHGFINSVIIVAVNHDENGVARFDFVNAIRFVYKNRYYEDEKDFLLPDEFMASSFADYFIAQYEQAIAPSAQN